MKKKTIYLGIGLRTFSAFSSAYYNQPYVYKPKISFPV